MDSAVDLPAELVEAIRAASSIGVITGAGVSKASGIATYRGSDGLYEQGAEGVRTVEALSAPTLRNDPDRTWRVLAELARAAAAAEPNPAHEAIASFESHFDRVVLLTQNVDGLHRRAGSSAPIMIHGDVFHTRCLACQEVAPLTVETLASLDRQPRCASCAGPLRPGVVLFEEMLPELEVERLEQEFLSNMPDVVVIAGTTALFPYILAPVDAAIQLGIPTVDVNPAPRPVLPGVRHHLAIGAEHALPAILRVRTGQS